jgi:hypothetical protein
LNYLFIILAWRVSRKRGSSGGPLKRHLIRKGSLGVEKVNLIRVSWRIQIKYDWRRGNIKRCLQIQRRIEGILKITQWKQIII